MQFTRISVNSFRPRVTRVRPSDVSSTYRSSNNSDSPPALVSLFMCPKRCSYGQLACCFCLAITLALLVSAVIGTVLAIVLPHTTTLSTTATTATTTTATKSGGRSDLMLYLTRASAGLDMQIYYWPRQISP
ncbi:unnamed protein product [Adineta steineri]|uniref:Uncharacterized protein n=1 Tax=Adineta steineri TaxID=433720 RepID=A0A813STN1_9BILA|nr:unnamed protein product [Adineta steineri]